jgi:hypothetical protein
MPDFHTGCYIISLNYLFYNNEKLIYAMNNPIDDTTVAYALKAVNDTIKI